MPTTSNFGWTTPADTDLVKDGAAAIRTLGNGIDTSFLDLKGGTTDQVLAKNSNTDLDFKWVAQDDSNAIQNAIVDAKGDMISATAADTPARLASSGVNGDVLQVDTSTATGLKWGTVSAGGMTQLASGSLSGASVALTSISGSYNDLILIVRNFRPATDSATLIMRFNNDSNARYASTASTASSGETFTNNEMVMTAGNDDTVANGFISIKVFDYANTATWKYAESSSVLVNSTTTTNGNFQRRSVAYNQTGAITEINILPSLGNFTSGSYILYGVK